MNKIFFNLKNAAAKASVLGTTALISLQTYALNKIDLTQDTSGGKTVNDIATNIDDAAQTGAALIIQLVTIGGYIVVALSLYGLYKASKEDRDSKPLPAILGLFIGGAMAGVGTIMWMMKTTVTG